MYAKLIEDKRKTIYINGNIIPFSTYPENLDVYLLKHDILGTLFI